MEVRRQTTLPADLNAALDWWREAGVDYVFDDTPRQWIAITNAQDADVVPGDANSFPAVKALPPPPAPTPALALIGGDRANWPDELAAFTQWWQCEPSLDFGQLRGRVPPRGPRDAALMVLVTEPEAEDSDTLLSGPQGRLLAAMLSAMGLLAMGPSAVNGLAEQVYYASALPRHTPMADWADLAAQGLGDVLRHHVALARPQRVIAFGRHISMLLGLAGLEPALTANSSTQKMPVLPSISHRGKGVPLLVARDLGSLLERPIAKGAFWQHWLEWNAGE